MTFTDAQRSWCEAQLGRYFSSEGVKGIAVDYKHDAAGIGAFLIVERHGRLQGEVYKHYPPGVRTGHQYVKGGLFA